MHTINSHIEENFVNKFQLFVPFTSAARCGEIGQKPITPKLREADKFAEIKCYKLFNENKIKQ